MEALEVKKYYQWRSGQRSGRVEVYMAEDDNNIWFESSRFVAKDIGIIAQNKTRNLKKFKIVRKFGLIPPIKVIIRDIISIIINNIFEIEFNSRSNLPFFVRGMDEFILHLVSNPVNITIPKILFVASTVLAQIVFSNDKGSFLSIIWLDIESLSRK